ncbi:flagellar FlhE family protein [Collimonas arenae]|uniref:Flagellar FlhE family protein n=2 Tax=Collimonas arenae TaxID=279058 RepID=A0A127PLZ6_9BURK|nr:flagellar FlhE family protein [Collimonas arenae]AMP08717.1 flagellar FlhE family protein [Collimonas arenae]
MQIMLPCAVRAGSQAPAALELDTYLGRSNNPPSGQGALQLNSAAAKVSGTWSGSGSTPAIIHRGAVYQAASIAPVGSGVTPSSKTRRVSWQYSFLSAPPAGVHAYLCNYARCVGLSGSSGSTTAFAGDSGFSYFSFAFFIDGKGAMTPTLQGSSSRVMVDYE